MLVFESVWVICENPSFLYSLNVPIKMFVNSVAVLTQKTLGSIDHVHCFQTQSTESCLVWFWVGKRAVCLFVLYKKTVWIPRLGSELMVSGTDLKFTFYFKLFLSL